jgi:hypothetical protein
MPDDVSSSAQGADALAAEIQGFFKDHTGFRLCGLAALTSVPASEAHDALSGGFAEAMEAWGRLIDADVAAMRAAALDLEGADRQLALAMMGIGRERP